MRPVLSHWSMILPALLWLLAFQAVPLALVVLISVATRGLYGSVVFDFTLESYRRFFDPLYLSVVADSLWVAGVTTVACLLLGYPFAWFVASQPEHRRPVLLLLVVIPMWVNMLTRTYAWMILLRGNGPINRALMSLGILEQPLELLHSPATAVLGLVYVLLPFMILALYTSIEKFDHRLIQAAYDLGASRWKAFARVTLPLTLPGIAAGSILVFIPSLALFFVTDLLGGARTVLMGNLIHRQFTQARDWPFGAAATVILTVLSLALIFLHQRLLRTDTGEEEWR